MKSAVGAAEFGAIPRGTFAPDSGVNFRWTGKDKLRGHSVNVLSMDASATSSVAIQDPARGGHLYHVAVAGEVLADAETNAILRLPVRLTVPPKDISIETPIDPEFWHVSRYELGLELTLDYKSLNAGGRQVALPDRFEVPWHRNVPYTAFAIRAKPHPGDPPDPEEFDTVGQFKQCRADTAKSSIDYSGGQSAPNGEAHSVVNFGGVDSQSPPYR